MIRLLTWDSSDELRLVKFDDTASAPPYAILSHTWDQDEEQEVTYDDVQAGNATSKCSYEKIVFCTRQAARDDLTFVWIDTCCIDRRNNSEVAEAINCMFRYYQQAERCYVYLSDVSLDSEISDLPLASKAWMPMFEQSRWFRRGWTLQELLAPRHVHFYDRGGRLLGDKASLEELIYKATKIPRKALRGGDLCRFSVADRMSWTCGRETRKVEDQIYCLLGIFKVSMSLIYGEGLPSAKRRLREEILRKELLKDECGDTEQASARTGLVIPHELITAHDILALSQSVTAQQDFGCTSKPLPLNATPNVSTCHLRQLLHWFANQLRKALSFSDILVTGRSFRPEGYSMLPLGRSLICYSLESESVSPSAIVVTQDIHYAMTQRCWIRLRIRLTVGSDSSYWETVVQHKKHKSTLVSYIGWYDLPQEVENLVHNYAKANNDLKDDTEIGIQLGSPLQAPSHDRSPRVTTLSRTLNSDEEYQLRHLTELILHQDIPTYFDDDLVIGSVTATWSVADVQGNFHWYRPVLAGSLSIDISRRRLQAMIATRNIPFTSQLIGVVLDSKTRLLKGILGELPANGPLFAVIAQHYEKQRRFISWERKVKWARQLITGIASMHAVNATVCGLRTYSFCVCVDSNDDVVVQAVSHADHPSIHRNAGLTPPEYRNEAYGLSNGHVDTKFDVFQLGLLLWHLVREQDQLGSHDFCRLADCTSSGFPDTPCSKPHADPIGLPQCPGDTPEYLKDIITLCRRERPEERPPAWKLLQMFPSRTDSTATKQHQLLQERPNTSSLAMRSQTFLTRLEDVHRIYPQQDLCDICRKRTGRYIYYCKFCNQGSFDLCYECFLQGKHCLDDAHYLVEQDTEDWFSRERKQKLVHYSSPRGAEGRLAIYE